MQAISRRGFLAGMAALGAGATLPAQGGERKSHFRFVHITDLHIQPELEAAAGVAQAVKKILSLRPRPDFVLTGGDHVMDVLAVGRERANLQFRLLTEALKPLEMPLYSAVGNHDVYGWSAGQEATKAEPDYGKRMFEERFAQGPCYRAFDHKGWHFVVLDSIQPKPDGWKAEIDETQMQWLKDDLAKGDKGRPVVLMTHVPLLTLYPQYAEGTLATPTETGIVRNGKEVKELIAPYHVKAVLQGHTHVVEECIYTGTHYITSGAICGDWWKGPRLGVHPEGFAVFDVDGDTFRWQYVSYGWKAKTT